MKLRSGDMLIMDHGNDALKLQIIGRYDVPRVEKEGRGWRDGATVILKGADVAEFLGVIGNTSGEYIIGNSGLSVKAEYDAVPSSCSELPVLVLSVMGVSAKLTWHERTLLMYAVRDFAGRMFQ